MINRHAMEERDQFIEDYGHKVLIDGTYLFADGARADADPMGQVFEPPTDKYTKAQLIEQYWLAVSQADEQQFDDFKMYLNGVGKRLDHWATLYTDTDRLNFLKQLQQQAKKSRARYMKAKREVKDNRPFHLDEREQAEAEEQQQKQKFLSLIDQITI